MGGGIGFGVAHRGIDAVWRGALGERHGLVVEVAESYLGDRARDVLGCELLA
jgi:hypothetical protein